MNSFKESILKNRRKHDSKTFLIHILLFVISSLFNTFAFLTLQNSNIDKRWYRKTFSTQYSECLHYKALNIKSTFYQNFFFLLSSTFQTFRRLFLTSQVRLGKHSHFKLLSPENNNKQTWGLH